MGAETVRVSKPRNSFVWDLPAHPQLELLLCHSTTIKLLHEARRLGLCYGILRIEGMRVTFCVSIVCGWSQMGVPLVQWNFPVGRGFGLRVKISGSGSVTVRVASEWSGGKVSLTQILYLQELEQP